MGLARNEFEKASAEPLRARYHGVFTVAHENGSAWTVVRSAGHIALVDDRGDEVERYMLGAGDVLHCADGARLARGAPVVSRDPFFAELFLADVPPGVRATVRYVGLEPGITLREALDEVTGLSRQWVGDAAGGQPPALALSPAEGETSWPGTQVLLPSGTVLNVKDGAIVVRGDRLAGVPRPPWDHGWEAWVGGVERLEQLLEARANDPVGTVAPIDGVLRITHRGRWTLLTIEDPQGVPLRRVPVPRSIHCIVRDGDRVRRGDPLTDHSVHHGSLLDAVGPDELAAHLCDELAAVFAHSGVQMPLPHLELCVRAMLSRVRVVDPGDSPLLAGEVIARDAADHTNDVTIARGGCAARCEPVLTGVSALLREATASDHAGLSFDRAAVPHGQSFFARRP